MDGTQRRDSPPEVVVLWQRGGMTCTCRTHRANRVEITLVVVGAVVERRVFTDTETASQFAIEKMRAYEGLPPVVRGRD